MDSDELAGTGVAGRSGLCHPLSKEPVEGNKGLPGCLAQRSAWEIPQVTGTGWLNGADSEGQPREPWPRALLVRQRKGGLSRPRLSLRQRDLGDTAPVCVTCPTGSLLTTSPAVRCADGAGATRGGYSSGELSQRQSCAVTSGNPLEPDSPVWKPEQKPLPCNPGQAVHLPGPQLSHL